ncbi:protein kinase [Ktedonobacteria bacterium brp13]|nr:protein kinase [Ktedonobacteria bacterium brp13]
MRNLERLTVETGRVIQQRYQLQRLIRQGQTCAVYQGFDQVLQRAVAVKIASPEYIQAYRAAMRATAQFTHPNIVGVYDLIVEPDALYIVQEYVEGDDFGTLLQSQLTPYYVVDFGVQICQALMYAGTPARKICHGDLTPSAIIRDKRGSVRVNNFALPPEIQYFAAWSVVGGDPAAPLSDMQLPVGQASGGRHADDTRAVGLLLYQLLAGRAPDARVVESPADGRLRFMRNTPPEVCEIIARTLIHQHPQYISTPAVLHAELKVLAEALEPPPVPLAIPAIPAYQTTEDIMQVGSPQFAPMRSGNLVSQPLVREGVRIGSDVDYAPRTAGMYDPGQQMMEQPQPGMQTMADVGMYPQGGVSYAGAQYAPVPRRMSPILIILFGLILFALFFGIGYFLSTIIHI